MIETQHDRLVLVRGPRLRSWRENIGRELISLVVAIAWYLLLTLGAYSVSLNVEHDIGSDAAPIHGLYRPERNRDFSYAYSRGQSSLVLPQAGIGHFVVDVRMGGPNGELPLEAQLSSAGQHVHLGTVSTPRSFHLLVRSNPDGDVISRILSPTTRLTSDERALGVLLDRWDISSIGSCLPPPFLLLTAPVGLALLSLTLARGGVPHRWRQVVLLAASTAFGLGIVISRGKIAIEPSWFAALVSLMSAFIVASFLEALHFASPLYTVISLFAIWRTLTWIAAGIGIWYSSALFPFEESISTPRWPNYTVDRTHFIWKTFAEGWLGWDGEHYYNITVKGYSFFNEPWPNIAFFPLYPLLSRLILAFTIDFPAIALLLVSNLALLTALFLLYDLVAHDFGTATAYRTLVLLLVFPTSFFFAAAYSESVALVMAVAAVWAIRRERWWLAGVAGFLLALSRLPGVMMAVVLAVAYLQRHNWRWRSLRPDFLAVLLPPLGLSVFMLYQWRRFGTPWAFLIAQRNWDNQASYPWVMLQQILEAIQSSPDWEIAVFRLCVWVTFLAFTLLALRRLPLPYGLSALLFLAPAYLASYGPGSLPRHVLIAFPVFVVMAMVTKSVQLQRLLVTTMLILLAIGTILFVNSFWVA